MLAIFFSFNIALADEWESVVDGQKAYSEVQALLKYKKAQAAEVEEIFYGLRDQLYVVQPSSNTNYENNFLTPSTALYTVDVSAKYNTNAVNALYKNIQKASHLKHGENKITFKFSTGDLTIHIYDEIYPIYENLVRGGYAFEARAVLLDKEQTVIASSDNSLLLRVPSNGNGLDFKGKPYLQSYVKAEPPDLSALLNENKDKGMEAMYGDVVSFFAEPSYRLVDSNTANFHSLPVDNLKKVYSCRVLRESDELLVYKRDVK